MSHNLENKLCSLEFGLKFHHLLWHFEEAIGIMSYFYDVWLLNCKSKTKQAYGIWNIKNLKKSYANIFSHKLGIKERAKGKFGILAVWLGCIFLSET